MPLAGTTRVIGLEPAVCSSPGGRVLSTILVTADLAGTVAMYIPVESMVTVCIVPELSVITTLTPEIPGSP